MANLPDTAIITLTFIRIFESRVSIDGIPYNAGFNTKLPAIDYQIAIIERMSPNLE